MDEIKFALVRDVKPPQYSSQGANGIDFFIPNDVIWENKNLFPGESIKIPSGVRVELPKGYALVAQARSSLGCQGLIIGASLIDSDYRGEVHLSVVNSSREMITISRGQKLVQYVPVYSPQCNLLRIDESEFTTTDRGSQGFGSTGK